MIIRSRPTAFGLLFILRGSILPMIARRMLPVLVVTRHGHPPQRVAWTGPA